MRHASALALLTLTLAASCTTRTELVTSWAAPGASKASVKKVLVLGISQDNGIRRRFEDDFASRLIGRGFQAIAGYQWVPDASKLDKDALVQRIRAEGVTHVLVTRLVGKKTVTTDVPTTVTTVGYAPYGPGYYGGWGTYWSVGYGTVVSPGYTTVNDVVTLETNFYDASKGDKDALVWTGQTETWMDDGGGTQQKIDSVISKVVYEMRAKGII
ncbi:MAG TPA: hypothetical protein VFV19_05910 [Candidatus Polarisedimenticolaceae bacterium]|nr:hypothetical protein [Candidatus Polarisedimenticolaceae bacterium]